LENIIPENYDILNRWGVNDGTIGIDLSSNQEYLHTWNFTEDSTCYTYPVLPKIGKGGELDIKRGLQTLDVGWVNSEGNYTVCRTPKVPFLGRNHIVENLNANQCNNSLGTEVINSSVYFEVEWNWDKYNQCDIAHDNTLYTGLINIDFSELLENQVLNCINAECVGFVVGDYKVDIERQKNRKTGKREFVLNKNKLTQPILPKIITDEDGAL
jgi:hypothetical protein